MSDISSMTDAELDAAVAVEVMGWHKELFRAGYYEWVDGNDDYMADADGNICVWHPSTNIAHAWQVVENLLDDNISFELLDISGVPDRYMMKIRVRGSARILHYAQAPTAPRAICIAALMAVRAEKGVHG